jgi:DnaJ-class molecular chaperone
MSGKQSYYYVLNVSTTATKFEIGAAFRKLALVHHPDKGGDAEKYRKINEAYQCLFDDQKRKEYDLTFSSLPNIKRQFDEFMNGKSTRPTKKKKAKTQRTSPVSSGDTVISVSPETHTYWRTLFDKREADRKQTEESEKLWRDATTAIVNSLCSSYAKSWPNRSRCPVCSCRLENHLCPDGDQWHTHDIDSKLAFPGRANPASCVLCTFHF